MENIVSVLNSRIPEWTSMAICSAKERIYISMPDLDISTEHFIKSMEQIPEYIKVYILSRPSPMRRRKLPDNCVIKMIKNFGPKLKDELIVWTPTVEKIMDMNKSSSEVENVFNLVNSGIFKFNHSYILIDDSTLIIGSGMFSPSIGGTDGSRYTFDSIPKSTFVDTRQHSERFNDIIIIGKANKRFVDYAVDFCKSYGNPSSSLLLLPEDGVVGRLNSSLHSSRTTEEELICRWIVEADTCIYIETSVLISHENTKNRIAHHLVQRLLRAKSAGTDDKFQCVILANLKHVKSCIFEDEEYIAKKINYTFEFIINEIKKASILQTELIDRLFIGYLENTTISSLLVIQDNKRCLLSSSSICDRSLANGDMELGIIIGPSDYERIETLFQLIWNKHLSKDLDLSDDKCEFNKFFALCKSETGNVRKYHSCKDEKKIIEFKFHDEIINHLTGKLYFT